MEEFPQLRAVVEQGFDNPANVELVSLYNLLASPESLAFLLNNLSFCQCPTTLYLKFPSCIRTP